MDPFRSTTPPWPAEPPGPSLRRRVVVGLLVLLLVAGLVWGALVIYRFAAPYFGYGYASGQSANVDGTMFTVVKARCGLDTAPDGTAEPAKGQFCLIVLQAVNRSNDVRYLTLSTFSLQLETRSRVRPSTSATDVSVQLVPNQPKDLELLYDVWEGVRMVSVTVQSGEGTRRIPLL